MVHIQQQRSIMILRHLKELILIMYMQVSLHQEMQQQHSQI